MTKRIAALRTRLIKAVFNGRVIFDDQSYLEYFTRESLLYAEANGHTMEVMWHWQPWRSRARVLQVSDINHWNPPNEAELLSAAKRQEIQNKVIEYSRKRRIPLKIV